MLEVVVVGASVPFIALLCLVVFDQARKYFLQLAKDIIELRRHYEMTGIEVSKKRQELEKLERN
jgi:hypothetical protein